MSEKQNGSITAFIVNRDNDSLYELYLAQDGGVIANASSRYLFSYYTSVTKMDLSNWNTSDVTSMEGMFIRCSSLTSIDLSGLNTSSVTIMQNMFSSCSSLTSMDPLNLMTSEDRLKELKQKTIVAELEDGKYLIAKVELDSNSIGTDVLQAVNKFERKLNKETADGQFTEFEDRRNGTKFFRFINTDDTIIQGATVELSYKYTALNIGEVDYLGEDLAKAQETVINNLDKKARGEAIQDTDSITIKSELIKIIKQKRKEQEEKMLADAVENGKYLGEFYYLGKEPENKKDQMVLQRGK